jgi:hypothetical protein
LTEHLYLNPHPNEHTIRTTAASGKKGGLNMAGAFTHMAIAEEAIKSFSVDQALGKLLRENRNYLTLGSVSPDIPYLAHLALEGANWADIMHY